MDRAGFCAESLRWFCGADGSVVVEQAARWIDHATGADRGQAQVASYFRVEGGDIARYARYETWNSRSRRLVSMRVMRSCQSSAGHNASTIPSVLLSCRR